MSKIDETGKAVGKEVGSFLSDKPIWAWWIVYVVLIGVLFGLFYTIFHLLTLQWWVTIIIIAVIGLIWGSVAYINRKTTIRK